jgi:predicted CXXCH cytochrome family protein
MRQCRGVVVLILFISVLAGCEARSRYKTLSFFFDGVPDPDKVSAASGAAGQKGSGKTASKPPRDLSHGPYAAKMCEACHERSSNALVLPLKDLCFKCHRLNIQKKYIHGPVAAGGCRICHEPHSSGRPFLLVSEPQKFCFYCHEEKAVLANEVHKGMDASCTDCHDAHSADNRYFLK